MSQRTGIRDVILGIKHVIFYLRLNSYDIRTVEGRSKERLRRITWSVIAAAGAKVISLAISLVSVRLTVNYLDEERFGMWAMLSSFVLLLTFADLGIGNGLINAISIANGRDDVAESQRYTSTAFFMLLILAVILLFIFVVLYPLINWHLIFNVSSDQAMAESASVIAVFVVCFLINIPVGIIQRIQLGYQEGFSNSIWLAVGNIFSLIAIIALVHFQAGLTYLVFALVGVPIFAQILNGVILFRYRRPWLFPKLSFFSVPATKEILKLGSLFFILQIATALSFQSDTIIIAQFLGASAVTQYAVPMRLFTMITVLLGILSAPLWPAYGEAVAHRDIAWIKKAISRSVWLSVVVAVPLAFIFVVNGKLIVQLWVGPAIQPTILLLVGMGAWTVLYSVLNPLAMFLNGVGVVKFQIITASIMTVLNLGLSILLVQKIGVAGVIWATVISLLVCVLFPTLWFVNRYLSIHHASSTAH